VWPVLSKISKEYDREQAALCERKGRSLGLMGPFQGKKDWYGGKIQQVVRVEEAGEDLKLCMEPLEMRRSNRLARFYGSRRILHVRVSLKTIHSKRALLIEFLKHKFVLAGRVFVAIPPKDDGIYMVEVNEGFERPALNQHGDQFRLSYGELVEWHNPLDLNSKQVLFQV
jgi:RNA-dependent RNA polymerase